MFRKEKTYKLDITKKMQKRKAEVEKKVRETVKAEGDRTIQKLKEVVKIEEERGEKRKTKKGKSNSQAIKKKLQL